MFYIIEREFEIPFDKSIDAVVIRNVTYDIVKSSKNTGLESISDFIIDDNNVLIKSKPGLERIIREEAEATLELEINELLLG